MHTRSLKFNLISAAVLSFSTAAFAADLMPVRSAPAAITPVFTWTGFYAGLHAGYSWAEDNLTIVSFHEFFQSAAGPGTYVPNLRIERNGFLGGAQGGYNYQFGSFVLGVEGDISWMDGEGRAGATVFDAIAVDDTASFSARGDLSWLGTIRARAGVAFDRLLIYGTAGFAFGDVGYYTNYTEGLAPVGFGDGRFTGVETGYALGAGAEYAFINNWILRGEYLFYDLGTHHIETTLTNATAPWSFTHKVETQGHVARVGVNYKF